MWFDPHWHARDWDESYKETVAHSLRVAYLAGATAIAAMPNTVPPLTTLEQCREYLALGYALQELGVKFYVHVGLTPNIEQVKRAVDACRQEKDIVGMKAYFGRSTGNLGILTEEQQLSVLETLAAEGYDGVLVAHCEKEACTYDAAYVPEQPETWSTRCRPEQAEIESFIDIVSMAEAVGFKGKLHFAHVSTIHVVDAIHAYRGSVKLSCGITPHHLLLDYDSIRDAPLKNPSTQNAWYKCNPPLRSPETRQGLWQRLKESKITFIESDHAPHSAREKVQQNLPASGIANGWVWPYLISFLEEHDFPAGDIEKLCFTNAVSLYGLDLTQRRFSIDFERLRSLRKEYPYDVFQEVFPC